MIARIDEITVASEKATDALKSVERRLADMAFLIKNITTYNKTKPTYKAVAKAPRAANFGGKLSSVTALQSMHTKHIKPKDVFTALYHLNR